MTVKSFRKTLNAQASVLLVYCIFLFLIGLCQISLGVALRIIYNLQLHIYCYPDLSGALTLLPFLTGILYYIFKGKFFPVLLSITSFMSFIGGIGFTGILLVETHLYDLIKFKIHEFKHNIANVANATLSVSTVATTTDKVIKFQHQNGLNNNALVASYGDDNWFFIIVFVIFGLSLLQSFLSIIGMVLSFVWSPCCQSTYKPLRSQNNYGIETTISSNGASGGSSDIGGLTSVQHTKTLRYNDIDLDHKISLINSGVSSNGAGNGGPNSSTMLLKMKHFEDV